MSERNALIVVVAGFFLLYSLSLVVSPPVYPTQVDSASSAALPWFLLDAHTVALDNAHAYYAENNTWNAYYVYFEPVDGHYYPVFHIVQPVLSTPLYVPAYVVLKAAGVPIDMFNRDFRMASMFMEHALAAFLAAWSCGFVYLAARRFFPRGASLFAVVAYGAGTEVFSIASQNLWNHTGSVFLLSVMLYVVVLDLRRNDWLLLAFFGGLAGLYAFNRPPDVPLLLAFAPYWAARVLRDWRCLAGVPLALLAGAPWSAFNWYVFHDLTGYYSGWFTSVYHDNLFAYLLVPHAGILADTAGWLVSPSKGLLVTSPVMLLAVFGFIVWRARADERRLFAGLVLAVLAGFYVLAANLPLGFDAGGFGPRHMADLMPLAALGVAAGYDWCGRSKYRVNLLYVCFVLLAFSFAVQFVGAYLYPAGGLVWENRPLWHGDRSAYWDWADNQVFRSIVQCGSDWHPHYF